MNTYPYREPPLDFDGQPMSNTLSLRFYGCICRVARNQIVDGVTYGLVTYIEPDCPFRERHLSKHS